MQRSIFGMLQSQPVYAFTLKNKNGMEAEFISLGARITKLLVPDGKGGRRDVVLGYDSLRAYAGDPYYFGATAGRVCNRIRGASFSLNNQIHTLNANRAPHHLHGGENGFSFRLFQGTWSGNDGVTFHYTSPAGEMGYPGELTAYVTYRLLKDNALYIEFKASAKAVRTIANLTHHSYFNLAGHDAGSVLEHELSVEADFFTPADEECLPTGEIRRVAGTPLDFRKPKAVGRDLLAPTENLPLYAGYDHNFVLRDGEDFRLAATLYDPNSGMRMQVETDYPGLQVYSANGMDTTGKEGAVYAPHAALCLEPQFFPDAVHFSHFTQPIVDAWEMRRKTVIYRFDYVEAAAKTEEKSPSGGERFDKRD
ncbi:galactose mutarotase [Christensenellaceae bacterium OttesenSCG-928-L17]|nr:galactose mutarotase [Christensenellaceae bacterium OttesenSCG-928-L17]